MVVTPVSAKRNGHTRKRATVKDGGGGELNPRPAGYESASSSTEPSVGAVVYGIGDSSVATLVATKTTDTSRERLIIPDDLREVINSWHALSEPVRASILTMIQATRQ